MAIDVNNVEFINKTHFYNTNKVVNISGAKYINHDETII